MKKYNLQYFVYIENFNQRKIEKYNVLSDAIVEEIVNNAGENPTKENFAKATEQVFKYYFWARSEWEVIITDWPPHVSVPEVSRLAKEIEDSVAKTGKEPYLLMTKLNVAEKIDVFDQLKLNWDILIDYLYCELYCDRPE